MYARLPQLKALAAAAEAAGDPRPVILCEYAHSMGNSTGDLREHWEAFEGPGRLQGGFIWDWADQALVKREPGGAGGEVRGGGRWVTRAGPTGRWAAAA
jgi:beta-galactosidase